MRGTTVKVSVIMPAYNGERYLAEAIRSVLGQTHADLELLVVDDGSTDATADIVRATGDMRLRYVHQDNAGEAAARNTGLDLAAGDLIAWNDADDISLPHRLEALLDAKDESHASFAHSDLLLIDGEGSPVGYWESRQVHARELLNNMLRAGTPFNNNSMLLDREMIGDARFDVSLGLGTDTDFVMRVCAGRRGVHVPAPLLLYRRHEDAMSVGPYAAKEISALLGRESLLELAPEACSERVPEAVQQVVAAAVIGRSLIVRHAADHGRPLLERAVSDGMNLPERFRALIFGIAKLAMNEVGEALTLLCECDGPPALLWHLRGEALVAGGDGPNGARCYLEAARLEPGYADPQRALSRLFGPHRVG